MSGYYWLTGQALLVGSGYLLVVQISEKGAILSRDIKIWRSMTTVTMTTTWLLGDLAVRQWQVVFMTQLILSGENTLLGYRVILMSFVYLTIYMAVQFPVILITCCVLCIKPFDRFSTYLVQLWIHISVLCPLIILVFYTDFFLSLLTLYLFFIVVIYTENTLL